LPKNFPDAKILRLAIFPRGAGPTDAIRTRVEEEPHLARLHEG